ncbi:MAG: restriction endonuclease subunit S [Chlorobi bacterium]|nr:MAG: Type-1 restriction enzyme EcoKI specificity protein [Chlorobi bacterium OLB7]MBK8909843.1 restriction endonuclease subunit S [Chlorobiota bacterium]MBX7215596.1 restriction endonuclease subunit S [Candidatus Kapabacteria bacterium]
MNPEQLLAHFHRIANATGAIPRLRQTILDLAVRGKLVDQHPDDEPAAELLKKIQKEKERLVKSGEIKKLTTLPINENDEPFNIPSQWVWTRLGDIGDWGSGSTPSRGNFEFFGGAVTWLKSGELNDNRQLVGSEETVTELALANCSFRQNQPGDVLIAMYGATIGKVAILAEPAVTNQAVCGCTPFSGILNLYLFNFLLSQRTQFQLASEGGAQPNISKIKIVGFAFPLPPLAEQHRIVAKVDELMAICDELEAAEQQQENQRDRLVAALLQRLSNSTDATTFRTHAQFYLGNLPRLATRVEHVKQLRQTILNLAVRGKLVDQHPDDEPAAELLKKIQKEKERLVREGKAKKQDSALMIRMDEHPFPLPTGWCWTRLATISQKIHYGYTASANRSLTEVRLLRITDIQNNSVVWDSVPGCEISKSEVNQYRLEQGDILIARTGGTIGKTFLVREIPVIAVFASYLIRVQGSSLIYDQYLKLFLESPLYWKQLQDGARGGGQPNVNGQTLGRMIVALPPLAEQHRIVAKVDELMAICDELEAQLTAAETERSRLLEAILHKALAAASTTPQQKGARRHARGGQLALTLSELHQP